jgi:hypothetical protein
MATENRAPRWQATPEWRDARGELGATAHGYYGCIDEAGEAAVAADRRLLREQIQALLDGLPTREGPFPTSETLTEWGNGWTLGVVDAKQAVLALLGGEQ